MPSDQMDFKSKATCSGSRICTRPAARGGRMTYRQSRTSRSRSVASTRGAACSEKPRETEVDGDLHGRRDDPVPHVD